MFMKKLEVSLFIIKILTEIRSWGLFIDEQINHLRKDYDTAVDNRPKEIKFER